MAPGLRADVNFIDFERLQLHKPQIVHDMPADGSRFVRRFDGSLGNRAPITAP